MLAAVTVFHKRVGGQRAVVGRRRRSPDGTSQIQHRVDLLVYGLVCR
jgi:hypothetical protein